MAPAQSIFTLRKKISLTKDVFELHYTVETPLSYFPGQYIMFFLSSGLRRSYSIAWTDGTNFMFIIKRLENGGGGSKEICDSPLDTEMKWLGPIGHFTLSDSTVPRMFIGTGTGFAPLYFQIRALIDRGDTSPAYFVFGVRDETDLFYQEELKNMSKNHSWLSFVQYLSRADYEGGIRGYVTDAITPETVSHYEEFYLCGSPAMVSDARTKLESLWVSKDQIRIEQY